MILYAFAIIPPLRLSVCWWQLFFPVLQKTGAVLCRFVRGTTVVRTKEAKQTIVT